MAYSRESINSECERLGLHLLDDNDIFKRKQKVLVSCECGGTRGVSAFSLYLNQFCCKSASKEGVNNPAKGKDPWNKGRSDLSGVLSGRPEGSLNQSPFGEEIREKYRKARRRITINGQPWSGFKRPSDEKKKKTFSIWLSCYQGTTRWGGLTKEQTTGRKKFKRFSESGKVYPSTCGR